MNPQLRLLGAAASHGLLTVQIVFSSAFVGACELPWLDPRPPPGERLPVTQPGSRPVLPLRHADRGRKQPGGSGSLLATTSSI